MWAVCGYAKKKKNHTKQMKKTKKTKRHPSSKLTDDRLAVDAVGVAEASVGHRSHAYVVR